MMNRERQRTACLEVRVVAAARIVETVMIKSNVEMATL